MKMADMTLRTFADMTASDAPAPGGGSVAALEGAVGAALTAMVSALTIGKKKYAAVQDLALRSQKDSIQLKDDFLALIDRDTEAFNAFSSVLSMPKDTQEQKDARALAIQYALKDCTLPPLELMELTVKALELISSVIGKLNSGAVSDLGCAAVALKAAAQSSWLNVLINIGSISDKAFADSARQKGRAYLDRVSFLSDSLYSLVEAELQ